MAPVLEALQAASPNRFRGIQHKVTWAQTQRWRTGERGYPGQRDQFRAGARVLARIRAAPLEGLVLYFPQLPELADFARAVPDLPIIVNHIGGMLQSGCPLRHRDDEVLADLAARVAAVAACPNVTMKLGGIGMPRTGFDWHARAKPIGSDDSWRPRWRPS